MMPAQRGQEAGAGVGRLEAARLVDMAGEEEAAQPERILKRRRIGAQTGAALQEGRQRQHLVVPGGARPARDGASGFRRDIGEVLAGAGRRALAEIEAEAQFIEDEQFEARHELARGIGIVEMGDHHGKRLIEAAMGVALRQEPEMRGHGLQAVDGDRAVHQPRGIHLDRFGLEDAEMLV